jgi:predicted flavoprotein YhiN
LFCDVSSKLIVKMLLDECDAAGVRVETSCSIERVNHGDSDEARFRVHTTQRNSSAPALVVACGGLSIPSMGATGFGYELAASSATPCCPRARGLVPLTAQREAPGAPGRSQRRGVASHRTMQRHQFQQLHAGHASRRQRSGDPADLVVLATGDDLRLDLLAGQDALEALQQWQRERPAAELKTVLGDVMPKRFAQRLCEHWLPNGR